MRITKMKFIYTILLYLSAFVMTVSGAFVLLFKSPEFIVSEMMTPLIAAGAALLLTVILLATFKLCYAPDVKVYSMIGFVSGVLAIITEIVARQLYSIHGVLFFNEYMKVLTFEGGSLILFIAFLLSAAISGYAILLALCEYTTNRGGYLSEHNLPIVLLSIIASALSLFLSFTSLAIIIPPFMAIWHWLHARGYGDVEADRKLSVRAIFSSIITVALSVALFLIPLKYVNGSFTFEYSSINDEYVALAIDGKSGGLSELEVPSEYEGKKVGSVSFGEGLSDLEYLSLPETVFEAKFSGSQDMPKLISISVSEDNEYFKSIDGALYDKLGKNLVLLPSTVTDYNIPSGVMNIQNGIDRTKIKRITYNDELTSPTPMLAYSALEYISFGSGVTVIPEAMLKDSPSLTTVVFKDSLLEIGKEAFYNCSALKTITLPSSVTKIGESAFSACTSLASATLNEGLLTISSSAFAGCAALTSIKIPTTVNSLPSFVFYDCKALAAADLGKLNSFEATTFKNTALRELSLPNEYSGEISNYYGFGDFFEAFVGGEENQRYIVYEGALYDRSKSDHPLVFKPVAKTELKLYDGCKTIEGIHESVTKLVTGDSYVSTLGLSETFPNLTELTLGKGLISFNREDLPQTLSYISIVDHKNIKSVNGILYTPHYSETVTASVYIPPMMTDVVLPDEIDVIYGAIKTISVDEDGYGQMGDNKLFSNSVESLTLGTALDSVNFVNKDKIIGFVNDDPYYYSMLSGAPLKKLIIKGTDTKIADWSFAGCSNLETVIFDTEEANGSMTFGVGAFYKCQSLNLDVLPDSLISVDKYALNETSCKTLSFGSGLTKIEKSSLPAECEYISMRGDNDVIYNMNGILVYRDSANMIIPSSIKRITLTPSEYDLANVVGSTFGLYNLEYVELGEGAEFDTPVIDGVVYVKKNTVYSVKAPAKLKKFIVPKLDMPLSFSTYGDFYCFDEIALSEGVTDYILIKGSLYSADGKKLHATGKWTDGKIYISDEVTEDFLGSSHEYLFANESDLTVVLGKGLDTQKTMSLLFYRKNAGGSSVYFVYNVQTAPSNSYSQLTLDDIYRKIEVYLYSEAKPLPTDTGKYWHYDENGYAVTW